MRRIAAVLTLALVLPGCIRRRAATLPEFRARKCPKDSLPYQAVYNGVLMNHGELCMAINPITNRPMGIFPVQAYNPYTETDMDQDDAEPKRPHHRWKFWAINEKKTDKDKD